MLASGSKWAVIIIFANTIACFLVVLFGVIRKVGIWQGTRYDIIFFSTGLLGLVLWQTLNLPILALLAALLADFCFGVPTILKTWKNPKTETIFPWGMATLSGLTSLFALEIITFTEVAYPLYLFCFDALILLLVLRVVKK
jgi:hypothetical protein